MKKVFILCYYYPPCNLTASQRPYAWAKYLSEFGYYPIVITRQWGHEIKNSSDVLKSSGTALKIEKHDGYEVHQLPYIASLRDRLLQKGDGSFVVRSLRKILTVWELIMQNYTGAAIPHRNLKKYAGQLIAKGEKPHCIIATANPFNLFKFAHELSAEHQIPWIADYRDDWTTSEIVIPSGKLERFIRSLERKSELKWLSNASFFTTISDYYRDKISSFIGKRGEVILNGFFEEEFQKPKVNVGTNDSANDGVNKSRAEFTIAYNGTLYDTQNVELFISAYKRFVDECVGQNKSIKLLFVGSGFDKVQERKVRHLLTGYEQHFEITSRIPRSEVIEIQQSVHLMLMLSHKGVKGIPSSKLYEYLGLRKPILLCPSDNDILEETIANYNLGHVGNTEEELVKILSDYFEKFQNGTHADEQADELYLKQFTRRAQAKRLSEHMDQLM